MAIPSVHGCRLQAASTVICIFYKRAPPPICLSVGVILIQIVQKRVVTASLYMQKKREKRYYTLQKVGVLLRIRTLLPLTLLATEPNPKE